MLTAYGAGPHRSFRANVCAREGTYFYEAKILSCNDTSIPGQNLSAQMMSALDKVVKSTGIGAPRIGFARREHGSGHPVGGTGYSYGVSCYSTHHGVSVTCCGKIKFLPEFGQIKENDVVGFMITLPSLEEHRRIVQATAPPGVKKRKPKKKKKAKSVTTKAEDDDPVTSTTLKGKGKEEPAANEGSDVDEDGVSNNDAVIATTSKGKDKEESGSVNVAEGAVEGDESVDQEAKDDEPKKKKKKKRSKKKGKNTANAASAATAQGQTDVTGPPTKADLKDPALVENIVRERFPIRAKGHTYFESSEYLVRPELAAGALHNPGHPDYKKLAMGRPLPTQEIKMYDPPEFHDWPTLRGLPGSKIEMWLNGKYMGIVVDRLLAFLPPASVVDVQKEKVLPANMHSGEWDDGTLGYYPAFSTYGGAMVQLRFHDFWFGHDGRPGVRSFERRYNEQIAEDTANDTIDELGWEQEHKAAAAAERKATGESAAGDGTGASSS